MALYYNGYLLVRLQLAINVLFSIVSLNPLDEDTTISGTVCGLTTRRLGFLRVSFFSFISGLIVS